MARANKSMEPIILRLSVGVNLGATHPIPIESLSVLHPGEVHIGYSLGTGEVAIVTRKLYIPPVRMQQVITEMTERHPVALPFIPTPILIDRAETRYAQTNDPSCFDYWRYNSDRHLFLLS